MKIKRLTILSCLSTSLVLFCSCSILFNSCSKDRDENATGIPTEGLVAYYPGDENSNDYSGNNLNFAENTPIVYAKDRANKLSNAFSFNGSDGLKITNATLNNQSEEQTISLWFKTSDLNSVQFGGLLFGAIGTYSAGSSSRFYIAMRDGQLICAYGDEYGDDGSYNQSYITPETYNDNKWHHIVYVSQGDDQNAFIWLDGNIISSITLYKSNNQVTNELSIKLGGDKVQNYYNGLIDDVLLYNRALSAKEILALYNEK